MSQRRGAGHEPQPAEALLRTREVADLLQVRPKTVRKWVRRGLLEEVVIPGRWPRYSERAVRALLAGQGQSVEEGR